MDLPRFRVRPARRSESWESVSVVRMPAGEREGSVHATQFVAVQGTETTEQALALIGQEHPDRACVVGIRRPLYEPLALRPVDQLDNAVMAQLQPVCELADHGPVAPWIPLDRQHELVLLRRDAVTAHRLLAEAKVAADAEAETGQRFEVLLGQG